MNVQDRKVMSEQGKTYQAIIDTATALIQCCGYHAFSYADISERVGIRKASIHYYFPGKNDLVRSVVAHYRASARAITNQWQHLDALEQLERYIDHYANGIVGPPRMCLCALLAGEMTTLPEDVRAEVQAFYCEQEQWLSDLLTSGCNAGVLRVPGNIQTAAQVLLAGFEGAMLAARAYNDPARFRVIAEELIRPYCTA